MQRLSEGGDAVHAESVQSDGQAFLRHFPCAPQGGCWWLLDFLCTSVRQSLFLSRLTGTGCNRQYAWEEKEARSRRPETVAVGGGGKNGRIKESLR
jgi:hypothetical protein